MKSALLEGLAEKTFALIFNTGDDVVSLMLDFATQHRVTAAHFTAIGAFSSATVGYFDWEKKDYLKIPVNEQVEVVSLIGDIALEKDKPKLHAHVVLGKRDGSLVGGHLMEGRVRPTLEVMLTESPARLTRQMDPESGIALIRL